MNDIILFTRGIAVTLAESVHEYSFSFELRVRVSIATELTINILLIRTI